MRQDTVTITADQEGRLHRWMFKLVTFVVIGRIPLQAVFDSIRLLFENYAPEEIEEEQEKKHDRAEERRLEVEVWYHTLGIVLPVPKPDVSNREFDRRRKAGQELFWRFATNDISYEALMAACGQTNHWTVKGDAERAKIGWEPCTTGYWFWADVQEQCPRLGTPWNTLTTMLHLLSLEEYVITWWERKSKGVILDVSTWSWLRTRFVRSGALDANGCNGEVYVNRCSAEGLAESFSGHGGRVAEVVKPAA